MHVIATDVSDTKDKMARMAKEQLEKPGFAIDPYSLSKDIVKITHYNLNDNTVAGLEVNNKPIFSVQYHPEAGPGPHDSDYLFKKFVSLMLERC